jgi:hypothetical protein
VSAHTAGDKKAAVANKQVHFWRISFDAVRGRGEQLKNIGICLRQKIDNAPQAEVNDVPALVAELIRWTK